MLEEILRSCSNSHIAGAAVASIGGSFATRVGLLARAADVREGVYVAHTVRSFASDATDEERAALAAALHRNDQPILLGVQLIVAHETGAKSILDRRNSARNRNAPECCDACAA